MSFRMPRPRLVHVALFGAAGCGWNHLPQQAYTSSGALWDPGHVVPTTDGLYVSLPTAGALVLLQPEGEPRRVEIGEGRITRFDAAPDGRTVVTFIERYQCHPEDPREAKQVEIPEDCPDDVEVSTELALVTGGEVTATQPVSGAYNQVSFTDDGKFAIAYLDFSEAITVDAVLNLTGVVVVDLIAGTSRLVPVGFAADRVLFVEDEAGTATDAVVVSRNQVAVVSLQTDPPDVTVTFPLTLDPDTVVDPVGIDLTPDGRYALLSARGSSDLYALDLAVDAINIVELASAPAAMAVSPQANRTALVYGGIPLVEVMDHDLFELRPVTLDEPMDRITLAGDQAVLWSDQNAHDVYRLDLASTNLTEYRLQNPATGLYLAPTNEFAVALTRAEGGGGGSDVDAVYDRNPGMEIVDLRSDDSEPFLLEGQGLGVAFSADATFLNALVLQQGVDYLFRLDLYTRETEEIELSAPPIAIGSMPDGQFYITHDRALGLVSFLDPLTGKITEVAGFAATGLIDRIELVDDEEAR
ncbi:MAG: hypothetical protein ABMB14_13490 [Myxococcota bacterium]